MPVTFTYKDSYVESPGQHRTMTLAAHEFIRRFVTAMCGKSFSASAITVGMVANARELPAMAPREQVSRPLVVE